MKIKLKKGTRRWRNLRDKLQRYNNNVWRDFNAKCDEKVEELIKKYNLKKVKKKNKEDEEENKLIADIGISDEELDEIIEKEGNIEISQYGKLERPLDEYEIATLKLNPKFAISMKR